MPHHVTCHLPACLTRRILLRAIPAGGERSNAAERLAEAQKMLREADVNGDGRISREEFFRLLSGPGMGMHDSLSMYDNRLDTTLSSQDEYAEDFNGTGAVPPAKEQTLSGQRK